MSLVEQYHAEHKARLRRLSTPPKRPSHIHPAPKPEPFENQLRPAELPARERVRRGYESSNRPLAHLPTPKRILHILSREFDMSIEDIIGQSGKGGQRRFAEVRFVAIGLAMDLTLLSLHSIGRWLGGRDHSSIINGRRRFLAMMEHESFRNRFDELKAEIGRDHAEKPKVRRYENSRKWQRAIAAGSIEA